ncbi:hypothetical protein CDAR_581081 [Caerostris darwini]|uniref:Uncharacterized protein n=1 Tax=Caerostris darwini TaxID=1538125 RepID=A0AAV4P7F1_9ARAC|nr:hypothetical protein CDAR_581081 [Caerostris darwini]
MAGKEAGHCIIKLIANLVQVLLCGSGFFPPFFSAAIVFGRRFENAGCVAVVAGANISLVRDFPRAFQRLFVWASFSGRRGSKFFLNVLFLTVPRKMKEIVIKNATCVTE